MGFDLFMAVVAIVLAAFLTWLILWWYLAPAHRVNSVSAASANAARAMQTSEGATAYDERTVSRPLMIAAVLTILVMLMNLVRVIDISPAWAWVTNPWLQVILITPAIFYCGTPIAIEGWESLKHHTPDMNTLTAMGSAAAYLYSLVLCIASGPLLKDTNGPYFDIAGVAITLALLGRLLEMRVTHENEHGTTPQEQTADAWDAAHTPASVRHYYRLTLCCVPIAMVAASWAFALCIVFGYQPRLSHAIVAAFAVLIVTGLSLAAIKTIVAWALLHAES